MYRKSVQILLLHCVHSKQFMPLVFSYKNSIDEFAKAYCSIGIPITPKAHAVYNHIIEFLELEKKKHDMLEELEEPQEHTIFHKRLGFWSEQTSTYICSFGFSEALHGCFKRSIDHPE